MEGEINSLQHSLEVRSVEISHLDATVKSLRETHQREQADLLAARSDELCHFDEKLRHRDDEMNRLHMKVNTSLRLYLWKIYIILCMLIRCAKLLFEQLN